MRWLEALRDCRLLDRLSAEPDSDDALLLLEELHGRRPGDPRAAALLARARSERGEVEAALAAAREARRGLGAGAGAVLEAEVLLDSGRRDEARRVLETGLGSEPGNLALAGLRRCLDLEEEGPRGTAAAMAAMPAGALWCPSVLARLLLFTEREMERRLREGQGSRELHRSRTSHIRPELSPEQFRRFWFEGLRSRRLPPAHPRARKFALREALRAGDLRRAVEILEAHAPATDKAAEAGPRGNSLEEQQLALEIAFVEDRFDDAVRTWRRWIASGGEPAAAYPAVLAAYGLLAQRKTAEAREVLREPLRVPGPRPELRHLAALCEIQEERLPRAARLLLAAAQEGDIPLAQLVREEAAYLAR